VTRFYLVRHAEKEFPEDVLAGRTPGISLTERGQKQAEALAQFLAPAPVKHVFSSPLERAVATATVIARRFLLPIETSEAFNEIDFGQWTNRSLSSLKGESEWNSFNSFRSGTRIPSGESMQEVQRRVVKKLFELEKSHPNTDIVVVSHAEPIRAALLYSMRASLDDWNGVEISIASISILDVDQHHSRLFYINHTVRLPETL
jgi:broad specificity phosphatase PhoE